MYNLLLKKKSRVNRIKNKIKHRNKKLSSQGQITIKILVADSFFKFTKFKQNQKINSLPDTK